MPGEDVVVAPGGLHFLPVHAVIPHPLNHVGRIVDEGLHEGRIHAPVMIGGHAVEGFGLRELHALFLLHEAFRSEGAFHEVARAARKGVLFKHDGLEAAFNGFNRGNRTAGTGAHDDEVGREVLVGPGGKRHCSGNGKGEGFELGHGNFSFFLGVANWGHPLEGPLSMELNLHERSAFCQSPLKPVSFDTATLCKWK